MPSIHIVDRWLPSGRTVIHWEHFACIFFPFFWLKYAIMRFLMMSCTRISSANAFFFQCSCCILKKMLRYNKLIKIYITKNKKWNNMRVMISNPMFKTMIYVTKYIPLAWIEMKQRRKKTTSWMRFCCTTILNN